MLHIKVNKMHLYFAFTELMKNCIKEGPSLTFERAKVITKLEEDAIKQIKSIICNPNTQTGSMEIYKGP